MRFLGVWNCGPYNAVLNWVQKGLKSADYRGIRIFRVRIKVIYTKYSKHCPYTVAHTFECVCSKINHGLNHGLFISLLKLILCPIH